MMNKVIQDYILLQKIGSGQYGNVYRAHHKTLPGLFAVKVMKVEKFKQTPKLSEFTNNEIGILSKMSHPNIIKFVQMLKTVSNYYLVYEFCNGGTLGELIRKQGKLPEEQALNIFDQLRHAFDALHQAHILHRDLKPSNILFQDGKIKLADFGFCKQLLKENDMTQTMVGSPIYMAPEVLKGLVYDSRADIWSLGVILYEMLYGVCPYEQSSIPKLISVIDNHIITFPEDVNVSVGTKTFIKRMLTMKFKERISPVQFIKYDIKIEVDVPKESGVTFKQVGKYLRRALIYLTQSLEVLTQLTEDPIYLRLAFLVYKIIASFQRDTVKNTPYWKTLQVDVLHKDWTDVLSQESAIIKPFGEIIRQALMREDTSLKTKVELETSYIDSKYFLESMRRIENNQMRMRLINCFLYNRHLCMILEKRGPEWADPVESNLSLREKEEICYKQAKYY